ncbi:Detected protein of unknown function [Hibiscus syriacus]|uniref:Uncharacterized protein n=1 Tax=Hibiscus syriacus TaxID=106335 RepID=A0A6A3BI81_HIBSY|nr:Detected protein of unknown function [Hibiscus syriacus]
MAENPKLDLTSSNEISTQKISVSDHINGFQYAADDKSDSFVVDMEGSQRGGDKKIIITSNCNSSLNDKDAFVATSPIGSSTAEKPATGAVASTNQTAICKFIIRSPLQQAISPLQLRADSVYGGTLPTVFFPVATLSQDDLFLFATLQVSKAHHGLYPISSARA